MIKMAFFIVGLLMGGSSVGAFMAGKHKHKRVGKLRMDNSTGDPYLFMEIENGIPIDCILRQDEILLEVDLTPITRE